MKSSRNKVTFAVRVIAKAVSRQKTPRVGMRNFAEQNELIRFAKEFVVTRIDALEKDVAHCLSEPYAPFPAVVYCFATVDLLGALCAGDASKKAPTSQQSTEYMRRFMHYTDEQTKLLMSIFRTRSCI